MIQLNNLQIGYRHAPLPYLFNGYFKTGSLTAIMGANGTGKSTLIKTLCQQLPAISGSVHIEGSIAWLPQQSDIERGFPITVFDVVAMGCWPKTGLFRGLNSDLRVQIGQALAQTGIENLAKRVISTPSGGQFQRMLVARMLVQNADILLMDEPFTGIDETTQADLLDLIKALHQQGKTILTVLHDQEMACAFFPELLRLDQSTIHWGQAVTDPLKEAVS